VALEGIAPPGNVGFERGNTRSFLLEQVNRREFVNGKIKLFVSPWESEDYRRMISIIQMKPALEPRVLKPTSRWVLSRCGLPIYPKFIKMLIGSAMVLIIA
jgi:hypothetical protein